MTLEAQRSTAAASQKRRYHRLQAQGLCTVCGFEPAAGTKAMCRDCARMKSEAAQKRRDKRKVKCRGCGGKRTKNKSRLCLSCLRRKLNQTQNPSRKKPRPTCRSCGRKMTLRSKSGRCLDCYRNRGRSATALRS